MSTPTPTPTPTPRPAPTPWTRDHRRSILVATAWFAGALLGMFVLTLTVTNAPRPLTGLVGAIGAVIPVSAILWATLRIVGPFAGWQGGRVALGVVAAAIGLGGLLLGLAELRELAMVRDLLGVDATRAIIGSLQMLVGLGFAPALVIVLVRRRVLLPIRAVAAGTCTHCGYDRTGLDPRHACPECGAPAVAT